MDVSVTSLKKSIDCEDEEAVKVKDDVHARTEGNVTVVQATGAWSICSLL